jgi:hypothetical protein
MYCPACRHHFHAPGRCTAQPGGGVICCPCTGINVNELTADRDRLLAALQAFIDEADDFGMHQSCDSDCIYSAARSAIEKSGGAK